MKGRISAFDRNIKGNKVLYNMTVCVGTDEVVFEFNTARERAFIKKIGRP